MMQEPSLEMSKKERMTSVFTAAPRAMLLSETTDTVKLEVSNAMSQQPKSYREQWTCLGFNSSTEWCTSQSCNRSKYPDAVQTVQTLPQVHFLDKDVVIHAAGEARTNVKLFGEDICPIRQEDEDRMLRSRGDSDGTSQGQNREVGGQP